ncbi:MAG: DUF541 domain-containing protein [Acidimicrobiia bacterium]|nr:DUF541 domain-containing protein [Acidimicrobiia bacterium]
MAEAGIVSYGTGRVEAAPDSILLRLGTEARAPGPTGALAQANEAAAALVAALQAAGVEPSAVRTEHAAVHQAYDHGPQGEARPPTFVASTTFSVRLGVGAPVEAVIDRAAEAAGEAFRLHGLGYALEDVAEAQAEAARRAVAAARAQAAVLAAAAGVHLGPVRRVEELSAGGTPPPRPMAMAAERSMVAAPPIEPGLETIVVSVLVEHALA